MDFSIFDPGDDISRVKGELKKFRHLLKEKVFLHALIRWYLEQGEEDLGGVVEEMANGSFPLKEMPVDVESAESGAETGDPLKETQAEKQLIGEAEKEKLIKQVTDQAYPIYLQLLQNLELDSIAIVPLRIFFVELIYGVKTNNPELIGQIIRKLADGFLFTHPDSLKKIKPGLAQYLLEEGSLRARFLFRLLLSESFLFQVDSHDPNFEFFFALSLRQSPVAEIFAFLDDQYAGYEGDFIHFLQFFLKGKQPLVDNAQLDETKEWLKKQEDYLYKTRKAIPVAVPRLKQRAKNDGYTCLSLRQTAVLIHYLLEGKVIIQDSHIQTKAQIARAFKILTGYNDENLRQLLSQPTRTFDKKEKVVVQKKLADLISLISNDLKEK